MDRWRDIAVAILLGACVGEVIMAAMLFHAEKEYRADWPMARYIGHDCQGAGGDIWAMEESDFPTPCGAIEPYGK